MISAVCPNNTLLQMIKLIAWEGEMMQRSPWSWAFKSSQNLQILEHLERKSWSLLYHRYSILFKEQPGSYYNSRGPRWPSQDLLTTSSGNMCSSNSKLLQSLYRLTCFFRLPEQHHFKLLPSSPSPFPFPSAGRQTSICLWRHLKCLLLCKNILYLSLCCPLPPFFL